VRRIAAILLALAAAGAFAVAGPALGEREEQRYWVELDNAFGLIGGADVKVAGVRAGKITAMEINPRTYRARVGILIDKGGFDSLRADVFCESRPQSLIGEYYLDCLPGKSPRRLRPGSTIPVQRTGSTIPVDLVNNIMRRPYRERFSILLSELGVGLAARGDDLNETVRRLNPALRETDRVLAILADQRRIIRDLTADAERVIGRLSDNRTEVTRFIAEARDTAGASAQRADDLAEQFRLLPVFLRELRPTMGALEEVADAQIPALRHLNANATRLRTFLDTLATFSEASRPATRTLAGAARAGRGAVRVARPRVRELRTFADQAPEVARNLAYVLEDLDDRDRAVEADPRAPEGRGYTGLESILQYVFNQSQAINVFDNNSYMLKVSAFFDSLCANYTDAQQARDPARNRCAAILGPRRPGINEPDPSPPEHSGGRRAVREAADREVLEGAQRAAGTAPQGGPAAGGGGGGDAPRGGSIADALDSLLGGRVPEVRLPDAGLPAEPLGGQSREGLLDYLLGR
jgi:ABC-type transporter Mla subunit MlaD